MKNNSKKKASPIGLLRKSLTNFFVTLTGRMGNCFDPNPDYLDLSIHEKNTHSVFADFSQHRLAVISAG